MKNGIFTGKKLWITIGVSVILVAALIGIILQFALPDSSPNGEPTTTTPQTAAAETTATSEVTETATVSEPGLTLPPMPTILSVTGGTVYIMRAGTSSWVVVEAGITLQPGDKLRTSDESNAEITFFEGSTIELFASTEMGIASLGVTGKGSTIINLTQQLGKTVSRVKKLTDQESEYEIETPAAIAAVRGSIMVVTVLEDGTTIVENLEGDIRVIAKGKEVIVPVGWRVIIKIGHEPGVPEPIIPVTVPTTTPTTITTTTTTSGGGGGGGGSTSTARIDTQVEADSYEVYVGDTITYTYSVLNTGSLQIQSVTISDDVTGVPVYESGDINSNTRLDTNETWIYLAEHVASSKDPSPLISTATFTATVSSTVVVTVKEVVEVMILPGPKPLRIETDALSFGEVGADYLQTVAAVGGTPPYEWSLVPDSGTLPEGLILGLVSGNISGTPATAGLFTFTVRVTDSDGNTAAKVFSISIVETLTIDTESLPDGEVGVEYSQALASSSGIPPCTWSIIRGVLPDGLKFDSLTGSITGTPTTAGTWSFTVRVIDGLGVTVTKSMTITINNSGR
jgi:hypothetical protein